MAASKALLTHTHAFGVKSSVTNSLAFIDECTITYPCGHNMVIYNTESKEQQFIPGMESSSSEGMSAIAVTPNKRFIAIAEKGDKPAISIYDFATLRRRKVLHHLELGSNTFVNITFSADNKLCLTQGGGPEWTLILWAWDKAKAIAAVKATNQHGMPVYQADFCPQDSSIICVSGNSIFKFYKLSDNQFRQQQVVFKKDPPKFTCHAWLQDEKVVAATDTGELWLFENFEFRTLLPLTVEESHYVTSIMTYSKGFICGKLNGELSIYEKSEDIREYYRCVKTFKVETPSALMHMAVSPSEDNLVCSMANNQLYVLNLSNSDLLKEDSTSNFEPLSTLFHTGHITGMDSCLRKPILVTCGLDRSIRVWNYLDKTIEIMKTFKEEPYSVALHPSGLHMLVGFADKVRFMNILMDDIRMVREIPVKACNEIQFSNGGQWFAAVSNNAIQIFNSYSFEQLHTLRGHTNRITSLVWKQDDKRLVSCASDGAVFTWNIRKGQKEGEGHTNSRCNYHGLVAMNDLSSVIVSSSDGTLKDVDMGTGIVRAEVSTHTLIGPIIMAGSQKVLFAGTIDPTRPGCVRAFKLPITNGVPPEFTVFQCHDRPVTRLRLSNDSQYLFSCGEDGSLSILETRELQSKAHNRGRERDIASQYAEEILVTKTDLQEKTTLMQSLKNQVEELQLHNEYQLRLKDMNYKEKIKEVSEKFTTELQFDRQRYDELMDDKRDMEMSYEEKLKELEDKRNEEIAELQESYDQKIKAESERCRSLSVERDEENVAYEEEAQMLVEKQTQYLTQITAEYDQKVEAEQEKQSVAQKAKEELVHKFENHKLQVEEDADKEIEELKQKYDNRLAVERTATLRLKGENGIMKKKFTALQKDIEDQREEIRSLQEKEKDLFENIKGLEKDIHGHKKEIREREETIQDKEKRIYDLKKKNQELEKFKFVLDYKIKELKRQIEPRENEIADMRQQIEEMDHELEQYHKSNAALDLMIGELRLKMDGMTRETEKQKLELTRGEKLIKRFQTDLQSVLQLIADPKATKAQVVKIYKFYVQDQFTSANFSEESSLQHEQNRQRDYLEKSVESLKRKISKDQKMNKAESNRLMRESAVLSKECNMLRREYQNITQEIKRLESSPGGDRGSERDALRKTQRTIIQKQQQDIQKLQQHIDYLRALGGGPISPTSAEAPKVGGATFGSEFPPIGAHHLDG